MIEYLEREDFEFNVTLEFSDPTDNPELLELYRLVALPALIKLEPLPKQIFAGSSIFNQVKTWVPRWQHEGLIRARGINLRAKKLESNQAQKELLLEDDLLVLRQENETLTKKILIRPGIPYSKGIFDKSYEALSELKNFKKISFEFSEISTDNNKDILVSNIYLTSGNKIAYSVELEATTNPELKEGISGSASLSHYNTLNGAEHLQLTFKGSNNFFSWCCVNCFPDKNYSYKL